jgi:hypothetical protein
MKKNNNENVKETYSTRDIYLSATLLSLRFTLVGINYQYEGERNKPVGYFQFEESPQLMTAREDYWNKKIAIEPQELFTNLRGLRAQINDQYKNPDYAR